MQLNDTVETIQALARALEADPELVVTFYSCCKCSHKYFKTGDTSEIECPKCGAEEVRSV